MRTGFIYQIYTPYGEHYTRHACHWGARAYLQMDCGRRRTRAVTVDVSSPTQMVRFSDPSHMQSVCVRVCVELEEFTSI